MGRNAQARRARRDAKKAARPSASDRWAKLAKAYQTNVDNINIGRPSGDRDGFGPVEVMRRFKPASGGVDYLR